MLALYHRSAWMSFPLLGWKKCFIYNTERVDTKLWHQRLKYREIAHCCNYSSFVDYFCCAIFVLFVCAIHSAVFYNFLISFCCAPLDHRSLGNFLLQLFYFIFWLSCRFYCQLVLNQADAVRKDCESCVLCLLVVSVGAQSHGKHPSWCNIEQPGSVFLGTGISPTHPINEVIVLDYKICIFKT